MPTITLANSPGALQHLRMKNVSEAPVTASLAAEGLPALAAQVEIGAGRTETVYGGLIFGGALTLTHTGGPDALEVEASLSLDTRV